MDAQDGDRSLRKAKEERTQIAALQRLGGVKAGVRPSKENEDLIGKWVCTCVCVCVRVCTCLHLLARSSLYSTPCT